MLPVNLVPVAAGVSPASLVYSVYVAPPANTVPNTPVITAGTPAPEYCDLTGSAFVDIDGDDHYATQWQGTTSADTSYANPVFDSGENLANLLAIRAQPLVQGTDYITRVRYEDDRYGWSNWSANDSFTTAASDLTDGPATLPTSAVDFTYLVPENFRTVGPAGRNHTTLQDAINWFATNSRTANSVIIVDAGYNPGSMTMGAHVGDTTYWLYVVSDSISNLPRHKRVGPSNKSDMFQLIVPAATRAVSCGSNTRRVRFAGMSVEQDGSSYTGRQCEMVDETCSYIISK